MAGKFMEGMGEAPHEEDPEEGVKIVNEKYSILMADVEVLKLTYMQHFS